MTLCLLSLLVLKPIVAYSATVSAGNVFNYVEPNFNLTRFSGKKWYEIKWYDPADDPWVMDNLYFYYTIDSTDANIAKAVMVGNYRTSPGRCRKLTGGGNMKLVVPDPAIPAKMRYIINSKYPESNYWILSTDYDNFALTIACDHILSDGSCSPGTKVNVMSTTTTLAAADEGRLYGMIRSLLHMDPDTFIVTVHDRDCPM